MVVVLVAAEEGQVGAAASLALIGYHQAEHLGVETLHRVAVFDVDAHVGEPCGDRHGRPPFCCPAAFKAGRADQRKCCVQGGWSGRSVANLTGMAEASGIAS